MMKFVAKCPILCLAHLYEPGEELPTANAEMMLAWLEAGSAEWVEEDKHTDPSSPKAISLTAEPGMPGLALPSCGQGEDLAGKVPSRRRRSTQAAKERKHDG